VLATESSKTLEKKKMSSQAEVAALRSFIDNRLPRYATDAEPTDLTPEQLHAMGFRRQDIIQFHLKCYTNRNYVAFHKAYVMSWWELLGLPLHKIRVASAIHYPGDAKDLLLTYVLRDPIYLPLINRTPNFVFAYPGLFDLPLFQIDLVVLDK